MRLGPTELLIILAIIVILFGSRKLPELAKGLGQGLKEFKTTMREDAAEEEKSKQAGQSGG